MSTHAHDRHDDEGDDDFGTIEPDFTLIVNYLNRELSPGQMEVVKERLERDEAFFELALPLMKIRHSRLDDLEAKYGTVPAPLPYRAPAADPHQKLGMGSERTAPATLATAEPAPARRALRWARQHYLLASMAAFTIVAMLLPALPSFERAVGVEGQHDAYSGDVTAVAETRTFDLPGDAAVRLEPYATMRYDARLTPHRLIVWLSGGATITLPPGQDSVVVMRNSGFVSLASGGKYVLNAPVGDSLIHVAVLSGGATMTAFAQATASVTLTAGQMGDMNVLPHFTGYVPDAPKGDSAHPLSHGDHA